MNEPDLENVETDELEGAEKAAMLAAEEMGTPIEPQVEEPEEEQEGSEDDLRGYSKRVQERIAELTRKRREAERLAEQALAEREQAMAAANASYAELVRMRKLLSQGEQVHVSTLQQAAEAKVAMAKEQLRKAQEEGDPEAIANATVTLTEATSELAAAKRYSPRFQQPEEQDAGQSQSMQPQPVQPQQPESQSPRVPQASPRALEWAQRNPWIFEDSPKTRYARAMHDFITSRGVEPDSDEYYQELDKAMEKFDNGNSGGTNRRSDGAVVAASSRGGGNNTTRVTLTAFQRRFAEKNGIPPERVAEEVAKLKRRGAA